MHRLPAITVGDRSWLLPMADRSAAALAQVLLADDREPAVVVLAERMREDPPLVLWVVLRACERERFEPRSVADVARWLGDHALEVLRWEPVPDGPAATPVSEAEDRRAWAERVAARLAAADWAAGLAAADEAAAELAYLGGLLARVEESSPSVALASLEGSELGLEAGRAVAEAVEILAGRKAIGKPDRDPEVCRRRAAQAKQRWLQPVPGIGGLLPQLVRRLARLTDLEQHFNETLEKEKLEALAEFAAGAGHEINNPLAIIAGRAQLFLKDEPDPDRRRELAMINAQARRAHEMIADLRLFARPPRPEFQAVDLAALVHRLAAELEPQLAERAIRLVRTGDTAPLQLEADPVQLSVAIHALAKNSLEAIGQEGEIEIALQGFDSTVEIRIADNGPGILPEHRPHIFDPFYSARQAGRGLGLGLSKCWRIVGNHGGRIDVQDRPGEGAVFTVTLPRRQASP